MESKLSIILFLCTNIWSQEIFARTEGNDKSSSLEIPKKHPIDTTEKHSAKIEDVPYFVIFVQNGYINCGAGILSPIIAITAASCCWNEKVTFHIISGSSSVHNGTIHKIVKKIIHPKYDPIIKDNNLALVVVSPPFDLVNSPNRHIPLYKGKFPSNAIGILNAWECGKFNGHDTALQSKTLHILNPNKCNLLLPGYPDLNKEFCVNAESKYNFDCNGIVGATFAFDGKLLGILAINGVYMFGRPTPAIMVNLTVPEYANWIFSNMHH